MELKKQVCSLELAKRLNELGVKQESLFYWCSTGYGGEGGLLATRKEADYHKARVAYDAPGANDCYDPISAFTVSELGEMLPWQLIVGAHRYELDLFKNGEEPAHWSVG